MTYSSLLRATFAAALASVRGGALAAQLEVRIAAGECSEAVLSGSNTYFPVQAQVQADSEMAQLFSVSYLSTYKLLTSKLAKEQYVLTQCGQIPPADAAVDEAEPLPAGYVRKHFTVPVQRAAAPSTVLLSFIDALGVQDRVSYVDEWAVAPCWQRALACDAKLESSWGNTTLHGVQLDSVDLVFMDCGTDNDCSNVNQRPNAVHVPATHDAGLVESAEYIKFIAAFFNSEPKAKQLFAATRAAYSQASVGAGPSPLTVAWLNYNAQGAWSAESFVVSQATFKTGMVAAVGAVNFDAATQLASVAGVQVSDAVPGKPAAGKTYTFPTNGDKANISAAFFEALAGVDVVVDEVYAPVPANYDLEAFLAAYGLAADADLPFLKNRMVLRIDRTLSESKQGLDWFESRIARPEWALDGLAHVLYGDQSRAARYFRNIAKGETPDQVLGAAACTRAMPACSAEMDPQPILLLGDVSVGVGDANGARAAVASGTALVLLWLAAA